MRTWLKDADAADRVAVVHCKAGKGRSGTMSCAYLIAEEHWRPAAALLRFTQRRMRPGFGDGVSIPSQLRWVGYVARWARAGNPRYIERKIEVLEVRAWGLRDGVKIRVNGYVDAGRKIHTVHKFRKSERHVVRGELGNSGGFADVVAEVMGWNAWGKSAGGVNGGSGSNVGKETPEEEEGQGKGSQSTSKEHASGAKIRGPRTSRQTTASTAANSASNVSAKGASPTASATESNSNNDPASAQTADAVFRPANRLICPTNDINIDLERRAKAAYSFTMVMSVAHVWFNAFFEDGVEDAEAVRALSGDTNDGESVEVDTSLQAEDVRKANFGPGVMAGVGLGNGAAAEIERVEAEGIKSDLRSRSARPGDHSRHSSTQRSSATPQQADHATNPNTSAGDLNSSIQLGEAVVDAEAKPASLPPPASGLFSIAWDAMDGVKGSRRKGARALDRLEIVWRAVSDQENDTVASDTGADAAVVDLNAKQTYGQEAEDRAAKGDPQQPKDSDPKHASLPAVVAQKSSDSSEASFPGADSLPLRSRAGDTATQNASNSNSLSEAPTRQPKNAKLQAAAASTSPSEEAVAASAQADRSREGDGEADTDFEGVRVWGPKGEEYVNALDAETKSVKKEDSDSIGKGKAPKES